MDRGGQENTENSAGEVWNRRKERTRTTDIAIMAPVLQALNAERGSL